MHLEFILDNDNSFDNILWHSNTLDLLSKSIIAFVRLLCGEYLEINYLESFVIENLDIPKRAAG